MSTIGQELFKESSINSIFDSENIDFAIDNIGKLFQKCRAYKTAEHAVIMAKKQIALIKLEIKKETELVILKGKSDLDDRSKLEYSKRIGLMREIMEGIVEFKGEPMTEDLLSIYVTNDIIRNIINVFDNEILKPRMKITKKLNLQLQKVLDEIKEKIDEKEYYDKKINSILKYTRKICKFLTPTVVEDLIEKIPEKESKATKMIFEDFQIHIRNLKLLQNEILKFKNRKKP